MRKRRFRKGPTKRSHLEDSVAKQLDALGVNYKYEPFKMKYHVKKSHAFCKHCGSNKDVYEQHNYLPDFVLGKVIIEAKGKFTPKDRSKMLAIKEQYPDYRICMLFMEDNWLTKKHVSRYSDWCTAKGIEYAFNIVPEEWL